MIKAWEVRLNGALIDTFEEHWDAVNEADRIGNGAVVVEIEHPFANMSEAELWMLISNN